MPTIPQMIRTGKGEFTSSSLLRDGVRASGAAFFSEDRLAAADRIDALEIENKGLNAVLSELGELARMRSLPLMQAVLAKHFATNNQ